MQLKKHDKVKSSLPNMKPKFSKKTNLAVERMIPVSQHEYPLKTNHEVKS